MVQIGIFQYTNIVYLEYFSYTNLKELAKPARYLLLEDYVADFKNFCYLGIGTAIACLVSVICQFIFNVFSK